MRRTWAIGLAILLVLGGVGIGIGAYHAGYNHGLVDSGHVREVVVGPGYGYGPGFGFGFLFFPLVIIGIVLLARGAFWRRRWAYGGEHHMGPGGPGGWKGGPQMFEDWHRRQHGDAGTAPDEQRGSPPPPTSTA